MFGKKYNLVVGLTTFDVNMLCISVPALGKLDKKFLLIVHNDNPTVTITRHQIRKLGYRGDVRIINSAENVGTFMARMAIVSAALRDAPSATWVVFCDDDDILTDIDIPHVSSDNFAVVRNMAIVRHRVSDLLRVMHDTSDIVVDDENVVLVRPHMGFVGTPIRISALAGLMSVLHGVIDDIRRIDDDMDYCPPYDAIMWTMLNTYVRFVNPDAVPIYMDMVGYIAIKLDTNTIKYGRARMPARAVHDHYARAVARFDAVLRAALAAPVGHDN